MDRKLFIPTVGNRESGEGEGGEGQFGSFYSEFSLTLKILSFFRLAVVMTSVLVLQYLIETHFITL